MKKKLLIVESPAKIKTINKFLGKDYLIMSTVGHIKDLPKRKIGVNLTTDDGITIEYVVIEGKEKVIADLCKAASTAAEIYLAPDPDREGEIIAWHVAQEIDTVVKNKKKIHRISFNEITKPAIEEAIANVHTIDEDKVNAQQARRILDRWVGYEVSPILWRKISKGLSAGRVQSVALKLICQREEAIRAFKPEEYWSIAGDFGVGRSILTAMLTHISKKKAEIKDRKTADKVVKDLSSKDFTVESIKDSKRTKNPLAPFMTSTLQQAAYNRLGFTVQRTMQMAQKLYEGVPLQNKTPVALITYMRTDSLRVSNVAIKDARGFIKKNYGNEYLPSQSRVYSKKSKAQDAHEAIRPIDVSMTPEKVAPYLEAAQLKLYTLIWQRFVACQMTSAEYAQRQVVIEGKPYTFKVTGSTLMFDGFLKVYAATTEEEEKKAGKVKIPQSLKADMELPLKKTNPKQHFTQPPARYTEASLVKELEKEGIGRPSTYATILRTIQARSYTGLDERKRFVPSELGMAVTKFLNEHIPDIMDLSFTANMEEDLDKIAQGKTARDKVLKNFYKKFSKTVKKIGGDKTERPSEETNLPCPECKKEKLFIKFGKAGAFLGCPNYPDCSFTSNFERNEDGSIILVKKQGPKLLKENCAQCSNPMVERVGRYGPFVACSGYPKCRYIKTEEANFSCLDCETGKVIKRSWRGNTFWGCSNYPKCRFSIPGDIEQKPCAQCKRPYKLKKTNSAGEIKVICHNKECASNKKKK